MPNPRQSPNDVLNDALVAGFPKLYVVGSNHRLITLFSQQVRAINLVQALLKEKKVAPEARICIVGGGVTGLTAAAFAMEKGLEVSLYEQESEPLSVQAQCKGRWIHPHIYDWPDPESLTDRADLPVLNWSADYAHRVICQIRAGWNKIRWRHSGRLKEHWNSQVTNLEPSTDADKPVKVTWTSEKKHLEESFELVLLTVGFGLEEEGDGKLRYWKDDDIRLATPGERWLISGFGDGALADIMRICVRNFRQEEVVEFVESINVDGELANQLREYEAIGQRDQPKLNDYYLKDLRKEPAALKLQERLKSRVVRGVDQEHPTYIVVQGRKDHYLYGTTSAVLNRFVVAQLQALFESDDVYVHFEVRQMEWLAGGAPVRNANGWDVMFREGEPEKFDHVVVRHGPKPSLERFGNLWKTDAIQKDRMRLRALPQLLDPSRFLMPWVEPLPQSVRYNNLGSAVQSDDAWCLVIRTGTGDEEGDLGRFVRQSIQQSERFRRLGEIVKRNFKPEPVVLSIVAALSDFNTFVILLEALRRADVLVADVTDLDCGIMFLLGIRAAVRRGVSIVSSKNRITLEDWNTAVPFNLRDTNFHQHPPRDLEGHIFTAEDPQNPARILGNAIEEGLRRYKTFPSYSDLPGHQEVRVNPQYWGRSAGATMAEETILYLGPFQARDNFGWLSNAVSSQFSRYRPKFSRIIDEAAPQLANQRLYEAIRHARICMVDWTNWRANVFYELGMRLAVSPKGAISLIDQVALGEAEGYPSRKALLSMLGPETYRVEGSEEPVAKARELFDAVEKKDPIASQPCAAALPHDFVYRAMSKGEALSDDPFLMDVHREILSSLNSRIIQDASGAVTDVAELYASENPDLLKRYEAAVRERLLAAFFYMENRFAPSEYGADDLDEPIKQAHASDYADLCDLLAARLRRRPMFTELLQDIVRKRDQLKNVVISHKKRAKHD